MKKDCNGFGDFVSWVDENYGTSIYGEYSPGELAFLDAYQWRKELIKSIDEDGIGYRKDESYFEVCKKEFRRAIDKVNEMYDGYLGACIYNDMPACDLYNLISSMRSNGWDFECQQLCEELFFSAYDYYESKMNEYEYLYRTVGERMKNGTGQ